ncbi:MAG: phage tail protein [Dehalococcoidia bacterium]
MPDLLTTFAFAVEVDGITIASFKEASGIDNSTEVIEYKEVTGSGQLIIRKVPGSPSWSDITLRRRVDAVLDFWTWRKQVLDGDIDGARRNGSIVLYDSMQTEVARWNFVNGWPSVWKGSDLDAGANEIAVEEVTIAHEGLERA